MMYVPEVGQTTEVPPTPPRRARRRKSRPPRKGSRAEVPPAALVSDFNMAHYNFKKITVVPSAKVSAAAAGVGCGVGALRLPLGPARPWAQFSRVLAS